MRKIFNTFAIVALAAATSATLASCSDKNDEPDPEPSPVPEKTIKSASLEMSLYVNQDVAEAFDITAKTPDGNAISLSTTPKEVSIAGGESLSMYYITRNVSGTESQMPISTSMDVYFSVKDGYQLPSENHLVIMSVAEGKYEYTDGTTGTVAASGSKVDNTNVFPEKFVDYAALLNKRFGNFHASLSDDGIEFTTNVAN